jgi:uncharacterized protein (DUF39 family)
VRRRQAQLHRLSGRISAVAIAVAAVSGLVIAQVSYAELKSGSIEFQGKSVPTVPLSSMVRAREIADTLRDWIQKGTFLLGEPQFTLPR